MGHKHRVVILNLMGFIHKIYAKADSKSKREALESSYVNVLPLIEAEWKKDTKLLTWLKTLS